MCVVVVCAYGMAAYKHYEREIASLTSFQLDGDFCEVRRRLCITIILLHMHPFNPEKDDDDDVIDLKQEALIRIHAYASV